MSVDPHKPLRDDVRLLGELLGEALRAREGDARFEIVERVRALAKSARAGGSDDFERLAEILGAMPVEDALPVARAFSHFLNLANIAEQHHRTRRRRSYQQTPDHPPQRGSCDETFGRLIASRPHRRPSFVRAVSDLRVELVLTAHPTEIVRRTLLQKYDRIARALAQKDRPDLTIYERDGRGRHAPPRDRGELGDRRDQARPADAARRGPRRPAGLRADAVAGAAALPARAGSRPGAPHRRAACRSTQSPIRFGTWIGGDRDGNPNVTPEVTRQACVLARWMAADLYFREVDLLRAELSMTRLQRRAARRASATRTSRIARCCATSASA